ncbi:MAG TPA: hypothetical protein VNN80_02745 [Polyangiaceae bacterium]|nr:hypothetical protein [Polyangiaceae bacterium]
MIGKLPVLGFALVTAVSGQALAHEPCESRNQPAGYGHGYGSYGPGPAAPYEPAGYSARIEGGLRQSDLDRNGWVTLDEALAHGRHEFRRSDHDRDRVLGRHEAGWGGAHRGRHGQRRVTLYEYEDAVRAHFARLDVNRDGILARYELGHDVPRPSRSAGWWPYR